MGHMLAPGKGLSQSALPYRPSVSTWLKLTSDDVKEQVYKLAKRGLTPSQIGCLKQILRGVIMKNKLRNDLGESQNINIERTQEYI
uniref:Small ribosomal subunit protein uS15 N-terminal domain-containing protein n=1 Tax=Catagonus wagneri TaxID=51154 RepID=A0A8C3X5D8_9CETA